MKTLIGLGCSHTQGSAFHQNWNRFEDGVLKKEVPTLELRTDALKQKYNHEYTTHEWITENLSWIGKLNKHLKYDKLLNFGMGGLGIEANVRAMRNYIFKVDDLSNHLIIHQLPHFDRSEFLLKVKDNINISAIKNFVEGDYFDLEGDYIKQVMLKSYDEYFNGFKFIWEIYHLQELIESKGGEYRCFSLDFNWNEKTSYPNDMEYEFEKIDKFKNIIEVDYASYHPKLTNFPNTKEVVDKINWLPLKGGINMQNKRLAEVGLVKGDGHFTEEGNETIAEYLYEGLKKYEKTLKEHS